MPMANGKKFPYTKKGKEDAKKAGYKGQSNEQIKQNFKGIKEAGFPDGTRRTILPGDTAEKKRMMAKKAALKNYSKKK